MSIIKRKGEKYMCLINFQFKSHPQYKLIMAANRDEFFERPTEKAHFWQDEPYLLAGRDLKGMGTWLGITKQGRLAAVTNIHHPDEELAGKKSRGDLIKNYLASDVAPEDFLSQLKHEQHEYAGFNLMVGSPDRLVYFNNVEGKIENIHAGTHGLSNHFLNTPWPKVVTGKRLLQDYVQSEETVDPDRLLDILAHSEEAKEEELPRTGAHLELEKKLSPIFINTSHYGTRSSTIVLVDKNNHVTFVERTYKQGKSIGDAKFTFNIASSM